MATSSNMPSAEVTVDVELVQRLLADQHPDLADLEPTELANGWDNVMFRLGPALTVRLPRRQLAADLVLNEQRWLPSLAGRLSLPVPEPVRTGRPTSYYPWHWSVLRWLPGRPADGREPLDQPTAAVDLGRFLAELHHPAPIDAPVNRFRGGPLADRDAGMRDRMATLGPAIDAAAVTACWNECVALPRWDGPPMWLHGDLHPLNLLMADGRISAVIDFGDITSGDPATDLAIGFSLIDAEHRDAFRRAAESSHRSLDAATWGRARGWCLSVGVAIAANSADNPTMARIGHDMIEAATGFEDL